MSRSFTIVLLCAVASSLADGGQGAATAHYSALTQINRGNVSQLQVAWRFDSHDEFPGSEMECNPIVIDGVLFATTPKLRVVALDASNGQTKWSFDPNQGHRALSKMRNRGVAYWRSADGEDQRIYVAVRQYMYALDARNGQPVKEFGDNGRIDLSSDLGRDPAGLLISATSPPAVYKDLLIVGTIVSETLPALPGDIRAYDTRTGKLKWSFHTIPHPGEFGYETWPPDAWKYIGGVNAWSGLSVDEKRGIVHAPLGSATFDFYGANRAGNDLFANCLLALNAETGERIWHYQTVHHDLWDRDLPTPPALVTLKRDGKEVDAVAQPTKSGFVYVFERETGKPLFPIGTRAYPASDVDGEITAPTQPLPLKPAPFARQRLTEDILTTRTKEAHDAVLAQFQKLKSAGQFIPPSREGTIIFPGFDGGAEWGGPAWDPETGLLYINSNEMAWVLRLVNRSSLANAATGQALYLKNCANCHRADRKGTPPEFPSLVEISKTMNEDEVFAMIRQGGGRMPSFARLPREDVAAITAYVVRGESVAVKAKEQSDPRIDQKYAIDGYNKFLDPDGYPAVKPPWGTLNAIDLNTGQYRWKIPFGEYPELAAKGMKNTGSENYGGAVVTAGGLLFIGATNFDRMFHAFDKATGKLLWEAKLPAAGNATPAVYEVNGREFIVIACGGGKSKNAASGGSYVAFALPEK
ncbi:MAG: PQQ-binding-like beta-propeller repeat protein [Bryobacteraceae bacterium]